VWSYPADMSTRDSNSFRAVGEHVLLRFVRDRAAYFAIPMTVVTDDPEVTMLYTAAGTTIRKRVNPDGSSIPRDISYLERSRLPVILGHGIWHPYHSLSIVPRDAEYDIRYLWDADDWSFQGWYVNLQTPLKRVPTGFDSDDNMLDLTVNAKGEWQWKDEAELEDGVALGRHTVAEAAHIRAVGESLIPDIETRRGPFDRSLIDWRPDPAWTIPTVPDDWQEIFDDHRD
jgi:hypothetical protein